MNTLELYERQCLADYEPGELLNDPSACAAQQPKLIRIETFRYCAMCGQVTCDPAARKCPFCLSDTVWLDL